MTRLRAPRTSLTCPIIGLLLGGGLVIAALSPPRGGMRPAGSELLVTVVLNPSAVAADGSTATNAVTVSVTSATDGTAVSGQPVQLSTSGDVRFGSPSGITDGEGSFSSDVTSSTTPGAETITAAVGSTTASATLFEGPGWVANHPAHAPEGRSGQVMASDGTDVVLFGGYPVSDDTFGFPISNVDPPPGHQVPLYDDTWTWNGVDWTRQTPTLSPLGGTPIAMTDEGDGKALLAYSNNGATETWTWTRGTPGMPGTWVKSNPLHSPPVGSGSLMAYDPVANKVVLFVGVPSQATTFTGAGAWTWDGTDWTPPKDGRAAPPAGAAIAYDPAGKRFLQFGGSGGDALHNETWAYDPSSGGWTLLTPPQPPSSLPPARTGAHLVSDPATKTVVLFGGQFQNNSAQDTWVWNGTSWAEPASVADSPQGNDYAVTYDPANQTIVLGGLPVHLTSTLPAPPTVVPQPIDPSGYDPTQVMQTQTYLDASVVSVSVAPRSVPANGCATATVSARVTGVAGAASSGDVVRFRSTGDVSFGGVVEAPPGTYTSTVTASTTADLETIEATTDREAVSGSAPLVETAPATGCPPPSTPTPTPGSGTTCTPPVVGHSELYPAGYNLIGLPGGSLVGADAPLYSWSDQGKGGHYTAQDPAQPVVGGAGYWAWFACPKAVAIHGPGSPTASFPLHAYHASIVGNPSGTGPVTVSGFDFAARWDPAAGRYTFSHYRQPVWIAVGEAVWVFSYVNTTVRIGP